MPDHTSDMDLANVFADFFFNKITTIRDNLLHIEPYAPTEVNNITPLDTFVSVSDKEIENIIKKLATKSCELDSIPTRILKDALPVFIPWLGAIFNKSLHSGQFPSD